MVLFKADSSCLMFIGAFKTTVKENTLVVHYFHIN